MDSDSKAHYFGYMPTANLLSHLSELSPQARYVLMKLWLESGNSLPLQLSVQDCARHMAIPRARAGKVINELIDAGHIEPDYSLGQRGRPKRFIDIPATTTEMLRNLTPRQPEDVLHLDSVQRLLAHRTSDVDADTPTLSPSNLVFLIALLSCANECGAVHGLGTAKLSAYTGMTAQRINLQISKMRKLGVLLSVVPGITSGRILGRTTTTYWLDLSHHLFQVPSRPMNVKKALVKLKSGDIVNELFELARQIKVEKREYRRKSGKPLSSQKAMGLASTKLNSDQIKRLSNLDIWLVEEFFWEADNLDLRLAFQSVVDQVARNNALAQINTKVNEGKIYLTTTMLRCLYQKLLPVRFNKTNSSDSPTRKSKQMLIRLILNLAGTMADEIIYHIHKLRFEISRITSFELAPTHRKLSKDRYLVVTLCPPDAEQQAEPQKPDDDGDA